MESRRRGKITGATRYADCRSDDEDTKSVDDPDDIPTEVQDLARFVYACYERMPGAVLSQVRIDMLKDGEKKWFLNELECECAAGLEEWRGCLQKLCVWLLRQIGWLPANRDEQQGEEQVQEQEQEQAPQQPEAAAAAERKEEGERAEEAKGKQSEPVAVAPQLPRKRKQPEDGADEGDPEGEREGDTGTDDTNGEAAEESWETDGLEAEGSSATDDEEDDDSDDSGNSDE